MIISDYFDIKTIKKVAYKCLINKERDIPYSALRTIMLDLKESFNSTVSYVSDLYNTQYGITVDKDIKYTPLLIIDRSKHIDVNICAFEYLLKDRIESKLPIWRQKSFTVAKSAEYGLLLGLFVSRVLSQYEIFGNNTNGVIILNIQNIYSLEKQNVIEKNTLYNWLSYYSLIHAIQFKLAPLLKDKIYNLLYEFYCNDRRILNIDSSGIKSFFTNLTTNTKNTFKIFNKIGNTIPKVSYDKRTFDIVKEFIAIILLLEGHASYMSFNTHGYIKDTEKIKHVLDKRTGTLYRELLEKLFKIDFEFLHLRDGEKFVSTIINELGIKEFHNRIFNNNGIFPSYEEIRDPELWLSRHVKQKALD